MALIKKPYQAPEITSEHIQVGVFGQYGNFNSTLKGNRYGLFKLTRPNRGRNRGGKGR